MCGAESFFECSSSCPAEDAGITVHPTPSPPPPDAVILPQ
jgi:hypothetical protein